jgi:hypothetical protein
VENNVQMCKYANVLIGLSQADMQSCSSEAQRPRRGQILITVGETHGTSERHKKPVKNIHRLHCTTYMLIELFSYSDTEAVYLTDCSICAFR